MNISYRDYTDADFETFFTLSENLGNYVKEIDSLKRIKNNPGFFEISVKETLKNIKDYNGRIVFAESDGNIIGMVCGVIWKQSEKNLLEIGKHTLGEILDLYVDENYRGQGIGTKLLEEMQQYFSTQKCDSMWIGVFAENTGAIHTYEKFGFRTREIGMLKEI